MRALSLVLLTFDFRYLNMIVDVGSSGSRYLCTIIIAAGFKKKPQDFKQTTKVFVENDDTHCINKNYVQSTTYGYKGDTLHSESIS